MECVRLQLMNHRGAAPRIVLYSFTQTYKDRQVRDVACLRRNDYHRFHACDLHLTCSCSRILGDSRMRGISSESLQIIAPKSSYMPYIALRGDFFKFADKEKILEFLNFPNRSHITAIDRGCRRNRRSSIFSVISFLYTS